MLLGPMEPAVVFRCNRYDFDIKLILSAERKLIDYCVYRKLHIPDYWWCHQRTSESSVEIVRKIVKL